MRYKNPILPGFFPDPSICRVGQDLYLVTSSFEYFPGVPIFHSRDLLNFRQLGHVLTRSSQLSLERTPSSQGVFAPTIRHHDGLFYLITTHVGGRGNFFVTARDPRGPWSDPVWIRERDWGIDPSLLFDGGKVYFTRQGGGEQGGIYQAEIDLASGQPSGPLRHIWSGTGGVWPEGPHLYKIDGLFYLMISEGGTGYQHCVTVARSDSPWGPFETNPENPVLTHRDRKGHPIQATGHGDLVQLPNGTWWLFFLGIRPWDGIHHHLGRETFLAPVTWNEHGWPVINRGAPIELEMAADGLPAPHAWAVAAERDDFESNTLAYHWNFLRSPARDSVSLLERPGFLRLRGSTVSLNEVGAPAFVARRQQHHRLRVATSLEFDSISLEGEAGLAVRMDEKNHFDLVIAGAGEDRRIRLRICVQGESTLCAEQRLGKGPVTLSLEAHPDRYEFFFAHAAREQHFLGAAPTTPLSSEVAGGFTGVTLGMYATSGRAESMPPADFDWFEYQPDA